MFFLSKTFYLYEWGKEEKSCGNVRFSMRDMAGYVELNLKVDTLQKAEIVIFSEKDNSKRLLTINECEISKKTTFATKELIEIEDCTCNVFLNSTCYTDEKRIKYVKQQKEKIVFVQSEKNIIQKSTNLSDFPKKWKEYRNNRFLMHGLSNYGYYIVSDRLLGVPGNYYAREYQLAKLFGFPLFVPIKNYENMVAENKLIEKLETVLFTHKNSQEDIIMVSIDVHTNKQLEGKFGYYIAL